MWELIVMRDFAADRFAATLETLEFGDTQLIKKSPLNPMRCKSVTLSRNGGALTNQLNACWTVYQMTLSMTFCLAYPSATS